MSRENVGPPSPDAIRKKEHLFGKFFSIPIGFWNTQTPQIILESPMQMGYRIFGQGKMKMQGLLLKNYQEFRNFRMLTTEH